MIKLDFKKKFPEEIAELLFYGNGFIAGGAALALYSNLSTDLINDYDIWFQDRHSFNKTKALLFSKLRKKTSVFNIFKQTDDIEFIETENALTVEYKGFKIQLICKEFYPTVQDVLKDFDISICQIGFNGVHWYASEEFLESYTSKTCKIIRESNTEDNIQSNVRLLKYWIKGYEPINLNLELLKNAPITFIGQY